MLSENKYYVLDIDYVKNFFKLYGITLYFIILLYIQLGRTPLHLAAIKGDAELFKLLLESGSDYDAVDSTGKTPLYYTIKNKLYLSANLLLQKFCDPW